MARKCTNLSSLIFSCGFIFILLILIGYCGIKSDINRLIKGYDDCGNVCGKKNKDLGIEGCKYEDMSSKPKVELQKITKLDKSEVIRYSCVDKCKTDYEDVFNRCYKINGTDSFNEESLNAQKGFFTELSEDLVKTWHKILLACFLAFLISYAILMLFRYAIKYVIWIIYGSFVALFVIGAIGFWIASAINYSNNKDLSLFAAALVLTLVALIAIIILIYFQKRIKLVAKLFKEASKALVDVPTILFEPFLTFISLLLAFILFIVFMIILQTSGDPVNIRNTDGSNHVSFKGGIGAVFAYILNFISFFWFTQFILGCQHFIIAGTISKWYYIRDKTKLNSPISSTFSELVCFHLGSVCLASMVITILKIVRMIIEGLREYTKDNQNPYLKICTCCVSCLFEKLEEILKYLIRNAYIIVAKDGTPLIDSGRKAFKLIWDNLKDVVALNLFGDIVLIIARLFIFAVSTFIAYELIKGPEINNVWIPVTLCGVFSLLIAHCFVTVFEMTVDTIFICFCDDIVENDGNTRPYFMSSGLMKVMKELKKESGGEFTFGENQGILPTDPYYQGSQYPHPIPQESQPFTGGYGNPQYVTSMPQDQNYKPAEVQPHTKTPFEETKTPLYPSPQEQPLYPTTNSLPHNPQSPPYPIQPNIPFPYPQQLGVNQPQIGFNVPQ